MEIFLCFSFTEGYKIVVKIVENIFASIKNNSIFATA